MKKIIYMKHQKLIALVFCMAIPFSVTACGSTNPGSSSSPSLNSASSLIMQESSSASSLSASASPENTSSTPTVSSSRSKSSDSIIGGSSSTQQTVFKQINEALDTKVALMLPTSIPLGKNGYLTATTVSRAADYKVNFYETDQPTKVNSRAASKGTLIASLEGTEYKDAATAKDNVCGYMKLDASNYTESEDLGHNIKAAREAGLGHQYYEWNEGNWFIRIDYPTDSSMINKRYADSKQLASDAVAYLDKNMLPPPKEIGVINIDDWNTGVKTAVCWQNGKTVYQISCQDPMTALKVAVAMKSK